MAKYVLVFERGPNEEGRDTWSAYIPDLAIYTAGATREECQRLIREAIELYVETMRDLGRALPAPSSEATLVEINPASSDQEEWEAEIERDFAPGGPGAAVIEEMKADARRLKNDPQEGEILKWIEKVSDYRGWK